MSSHTEHERTRSSAAPTRARDNKAIDARPRATCDSIHGSHGYVLNIQDAREIPVRITAKACTHCTWGWNKRRPNAISFGRAEDMETQNVRAQFGRET
jgi:hypothetical protein